MHTADSKTISSPTLHRVGPMHPALLPVAIVALTSVGLLLLGWLPTLSTDAETSQFGGSVASIAVTMLGFMLAALAVLASINHTQLIAMMKKTGHYQELLGNLFVGCVLFLLCAVFGYALLFGAPALNWLLALGLGLHAGALAAVIDAGRKFWLVLSNLRR